MRRQDYQQGRNARQVARITVALTESPMTRNQLAAKLYLSGYSIVNYMRQMRDAGLVYVSGHFHHEKKGMPAPIYALGNFPDAVYDPASRIKDAAKKQRATAAERLAEAREHLKQPMGATQLAKLMFVSHGRAREYIKRLRAAGGLYIKGWDAAPGRGYPTPVYALGKRPDAILRQQTRAERHKQEMADPDRAERLKAQKRASYACCKARRKKQSIFAALGI